MKINLRGLLAVSFVAINSAALILLRPGLIDNATVEIGGVVKAHGASGPPQCVKTKDEDMSIIASAVGPLELRAAPTRFTLTPPTKIAPQRNALTARLATLGPERRIYLVLRDLRAVAQPGVLYKIYLDLPADTKFPDCAPHYVGALNFFDAVPLDGADVPSTSASAFRSYDITSVVKNLEAKGLLREPTTIMIAPAGIPASGAKPRIGCVELVER